MVIFAVSGLAALAFALMDRHEPESSEPDHFDGARAEALLEELDRHSDRRRPGAEDREALIDQLRLWLDERVDQTALQRFDAVVKAAPVPLTNIIGRQRPEERRRVLLAAPWDSSVRAEAGDASGAAVLLELASVLRERDELRYGVDFVLLDGSRPLSAGPGAQQQLGSQYLSRMLSSLYPRSRPEWAVVVDHVGRCGGRLVLEQRSVQRAPRLVTALWRAGEQLGHEGRFARGTTRLVEHDHTPLQRAGIPAILLIDANAPLSQPSSDEARPWCANDLAQVGEVLLHVLQSGGVDLDG